MNINSILSSILPGSAAASAPGLGTLAVQRQTVVQNLAIKQQAQSEQAIAAMLAQSTEALAQAAQAGASAPPRGSVLNILV